MRKRVTVVIGMVAIAGLAGFWAFRAGGQVTSPIELSPEVQKLIEGTTLTSDPGEPAEAIGAYLEASEKVRKVMKRIDFGPDPTEPIDPDQLLAEALVVVRNATARYPTSRHAWMGLGDVFWYKYSLF